MSGLNGDGPTGGSEPDDDIEHLDYDLGDLPHEERMTRARAHLVGWVEDDYTSADFVRTAAQKVVGGEASRGEVLTTMTELYVSFVGHEKVRVVDWNMQYHYVDRDRLRADIEATYRDTPQDQVPFENMPWLVLREGDDTPPGPP